MRARKKIKIDLKRIGRPLASVSRRLDRVIKTKKNTRAAKTMKAELARIRKRLSDFCENDRWYVDI
jgi:hypothetical protein